MKISRRSLGKNLIAAGTVAGISGIANPAPLSDAEVPIHELDWRQVHPGTWRATLGTPEKFTPVSSQLVAPMTEALAALPQVAEPPLPRIKGKAAARGCLLQFPLRPDEQVFGLGLQLLSFAQRGKKKVVRVNADPKLDTGDSHAPVPYYVTTEGIGILIDTARYATFYFGDARPKPTHPVDSTTNPNPDPNYTNNIEDSDSGTITVEVPRARGVDVYLFAGPSMLDAVRRYNVFSGGGANPPEWGLGFWYRMDARATQQQALKLMQDLRDRKIPCDVLGLEPGWQTHAYSCTFAWSQERFPDPREFVDAAGRLNFNVNLWEHAYTHPASPMFPAIEPYSGNYGVWGGLVPDFAAEPAREGFGVYHGNNLIDQGISGFKLDECDNSDFTGGWSFPECSAFPSGVDGEQMHSVFGLRYQMALWNEYRKRGRPTYGQVRSSGALAAPYPFALYSDLYNHRDYIRALVNSGFSGLLWCPEVRDAASEEDLIRRLQSVIFSSLAQVNCWYIKNPPWKQLNRKLNNNDVLIDGWEKLEARCREIIGWRMQLVPYLMATFQQYSVDGTPPCRALVLDHPDDQRLHTVDDQFMLGDRMMVAPLFAGEQNRKVVLPEGKWHDFWTGETLDGGNELTIPAAYEMIPVYVKSGSIVPWADVGLHAGAQQTRRLTARIYGDGSIPISLAKDHNTQHLSWRNGKGSLAGTGGYEVYAWKQIG